MSSAPPATGTSRWWRSKGAGRAAGTDPRAEFAERFLADTEAPGRIIVFNTLMEKAVLGHLAE
ncbi:MAG: DUF2779 domain-containing protein, partial [Gemmatimonadota bacterium]